MPLNWKILMVVIFIFLTASVVIGVVQLTTTPNEIFGSEFQGLPKTRFPG